MQDDHNPHTEAGDLTDLSSEVTTRFLKMGLDGPKKPIDSLLQRLRDTSDPNFFTTLLEQSTKKSAAELETILASGAGDLDTILGFKNQSVELFRRYKDLQSHLGATAIYFTSIAAALTHHGKVITSQSESDLEVALLDMAATLESPWADLLIGAVEQMRK